MNYKKIFYILICYININFNFYSNIFSSNNLVKNNSKEINTENIQKWANSMLETIQIVNTKSYYNLSFEDSMIKALDAFVRKDNHSRFLSPKEYNELIKTTKGEFYGIGVILGPKKQEDEYLIILDVIYDSPAYKENLKKYDKIIAIDQRPVNNLTIEEAVKMLKSDKRYKPVELTILRESKNIFNIILKRDIVQEEHVTCHYLKEHNIVYISLSMFSEKVVNQLENILKNINKKNTKGLILDLRGNPGGILSAAVNCASLFLGKDKLIVSTKDKNQNIQEQLYTAKDKIIKNIPIIILINSFTASAAEILAGSLRLYSENKINNDKNRQENNPYIFLLGTTSYGKGSVQEVIPISNNCAIKLTTSLYYLPNNRSIDCIGIKPDFFISQKYPPTNEIKILNKIYGKERRNKLEKINLNNREKDYYKEKIKQIKKDTQIQAAANLISILDLKLNNNKEILNTREKAINFLKSNFFYDKANIDKLI